MQSIPLEKFEIFALILTLFVILALACLLISLFPPVYELLVTSQMLSPISG